MVELISGASDVDSLDHSSYPTVRFITADGSQEGVVSHEYDRVYGYIMIEDNSTERDMLLGHVNKDWPLILTVSAQTGTLHTRMLYTSDGPPEGWSDTSDKVAYYYFDVDGLARDTTHTISVKGYVNDTVEKWDDIPDDTKRAAKLQYLAGYNINVGPPSAASVYMRQVPNVDDNLFTIAVAFTDANNTGASGVDSTGMASEDASYEIGNMEKITFKLVNSTGVTIGNPAYFMDENDEKHDSDYSAFYAKGSTPVDQLPYSAVENGVYNNRYVLTDASFGVEGDSRIANGGTFRIIVEKAYDYTQDDDEYPSFTNTLDISGSYEFEVDKSHARVEDPNSTVTVTPIKNSALDTPREDLEEDTVVGLTVDTGYSIKDAYKVEYYVYELTSDDAEPIVTDDDPTITLNKTSAHWASDTIYKKKTFVLTGGGTEAATVPLWTVYLDDLNENSSTANLADDKTSILFERGKSYFIRYEVTTNGSLDDSQNIKVYPHCAYSAWGSDYDEIDGMVPFYRSNVFSLARQKPTLQRYLYDTSSTTVNDVTTTIQQWKYKLNDPDNAILAHAEFNIGDAKGKLTEYASYEDAMDTSVNGTILDSNLVSLAALYDGDSKPKDTYEVVEFTGLSDSKWYTLDIPYCIYEKDTNTEYVAAEDNIGSILSVPGDVRAVSDINTNISSSGNGSTDYFVDGVMVKDVAADPGIADEYGYRIKLTLQGSQIERVAAIKVKVTDQSNASNVVIYDPVPIKVNPYTSGEGGVANYYAFAYLEYAPLVEAGLNSKDVFLEVEAYYTTYRAGMYSFMDMTYSGFAHKNAFTADGNLFSDNSAWAIKKYEYKTDEDTGIVSYNYDYQRPSDNLGNMNISGSFTKDQANDTIQTKVLTGSVFIPKMSDDNTTNEGFKDESTLAFRYTLNPLALTESAPGDDSFSDVMYPNSIKLEMDEIGAQSISGGYYVVEELKKKTLKIDFGTPESNYEKAEFFTGDGMPGIAQSTAGSSTGMSSATMQFDIKGSLPSDTEGYYLYLQKVDKENGNATTDILLKKYKDADGKIYYLVGDTPTTSSDVLISDDNTEAAYSLLRDKDGEGNFIQKVTFEIRGLDSATSYQVYVRARNTTGNIQDLFDYSKERGGLSYDCITKSKIELVSSNPIFVYNSYEDKYASFQYAVKGSEGTGMRIFYKVYDASDNEVKCGRQTYFDGYGYRLEPLGTQVFYYQSDMSKNYDAKLDFKPNGPLKVGETYKIVYTAYRSTNSGDIIDNEVINTPCSVTFKMPEKLAAPSSMLQVVAGTDFIMVRARITDKEKSIYKGKVYVDAYDMQGNRVTNDSNRFVINLTDGVTTNVYSGNITNLSQNQAYNIVLTADLDRNNDGVKDGEVYSKELTGNTTVTANANVSTSYTAEGYVTFKLMDLVNFNEINKVVYSIDSQDGTINYENATKALSEWVQQGNSYSYITSFAPENGTYYYAIQYYKDGDLKGSSTGYFTK